jgi:hypothetical protein
MNSFSVFLVLTDFVVINEKREHEAREISETREILEMFRLYFIQIRPTQWAEFG